jgi:predicted secreted acid phosphatase
MHVRRIPLAILGIVGLLLVAGAVAFGSPSLSVPALTPTAADQMPNIDVLRQEIKNYYGDPGGTGNFSASSNYAKEASQVAAGGQVWLVAHAPKAGEKKAIVLDVDDTTLATYNYEVFSNWAYNPVTNADYVNNERFPAVPGMVNMVDHAQALGYAIIYLTGRPGSQEAATVGNLEKVGFPAPTALPDATLGGGSDGLFTKPAVADYPSYLVYCRVPTATSSCNTDEYKTATRQYIESLGYDIVANFGDQWSDLNGGFADQTFKLPNPSYYLP